MVLKTNEIKTKFIVVRGTQAPTARSQETYNKMMKGGRKVPNWQRQKAACTECEKMLLNGSMRRHMATIHHIEPETYHCRELKKAETYFMEAPGGKGGMTQCPVPGWGEGGEQASSQCTNILRTFIKKQQSESREIVSWRNVVCVVCTARTYQDTKRL